MKCLCGYEHLEKWHTEDEKGVGDEKFCWSIDNNNICGNVKYHEIYISDLL